MTRAVVLAVHVLAGCGGLLLGPWALRSRQAEDAYVLAVAVLGAAALVLVALTPTFFPLAPVAVATVLAATAGRRLRDQGRPRVRLRLAGGSYVALVTALLVVRTGGVLAWLLPTVVGVLVLETAAARAGSGPRRRPLLPLPPGRPAAGEPGRPGASSRADAGRPGAPVRRGSAQPAARNG